MSLKLGTTDISGVPTNLINTVNSKADASTVVNTRFDGQWVSKTATLSTATAVGTYTIDLSDYLPNDNYNYEVLLSTWAAKGSKEGNHVSTLTSTLIDDSIMCNRLSTYSRNNSNSIIIPIGIDRTMTKVVSSNVSDTTAELVAVAYRRIGTNQ